jgi:DNA processing protein
MRAEAELLPGAAFVAALAGLPAMGPARLAALLGRWRPQEAWDRVRAGAAHLDPDVARAARRLPPSVAARWRQESARVDVAANWADHAAAGVAVVARGETGYPAPLEDDPEPPPVVFHRGRLPALERPRVAVVGTRRCTHAGRSTARRLGHDLAAAGVCVVSGLASGIDAEAHEGALAAMAAAPAAVVGTGLDVVYPRRNDDLWRRVAAVGVVLSEYPLGTRPEAWRFPARNRIIAALADVVVVVESHVTGGSLHTVDAALERGRAVMAVPGPVRSPASAGTNDLLAAGSAIVRDAGDVLVVLGLDAGAERRGRSETPDDVEPAETSLLAALGWEPATIDQIAMRTGQPVGAVAVELSRLEADGHVVHDASWFRRVERRQ